MFGRGRFQNGVLVQPKEQFDPEDDRALEAFRNTIWPSIEKMNAYAPSHSRVFKEMIIVTNPNKPLEYTAKGTPRRQVCIRAYDAEIDALYKRVEELAQVEVPPPTSWAPDAVREYVREVVKKVMDRSKLGDEEDLFQEGCDRRVSSLYPSSARANTVTRAQSPGNLDPEHAHARAALCVECGRAFHSADICLRAPDYLRALGLPQPAPRGREHS